MLNKKNLWSVMVALSFCLLNTSCKKEEKEKEPDNNTEALPTLNTCIGVAPAAGLTYSADENLFTFTGANGVLVTVNLEGSVTMAYESELQMSYSLWGYATDSIFCNHESLNGQHTKDRLGTTRSLLYPDGTKITLVVENTTQSEFYRVKGVVIKSGTACHYINMMCGVLEYSGNSAHIATQLDNLFPDGETSSFELTDTGLVFFNSYTEEVTGQKVYERVDLGRLFFDSPNQVHDLFEDPRYDHT